MYRINQAPSLITINRAGESFGFDLSPWLESNSAVSVRMLTPGASGYSDAQYEYKDGKVYVTITAANVAEPGDGMLYIKVTGTPVKSASIPLYFNVTADKLNANAEEIRLSRGGGANLDTRLDALEAANADLLLRINERTNYGVLSGLVVAQQTVANMTVKVSAGIAYLADGTRYAPAAVASIAVTAADDTHPRKDIAYLSAAGVVTYLAGTAAAEPDPPEVPTGGLILATIDVAAEATSIATGNITDMRPMIFE